MLQSQLSHRQTQQSPRQDPKDTVHNSQFHEVNAAIGFTAHYIEFTNNHKQYPPIVSTNLSLNPTALDENDARLRQSTNSGYGDTLRTAIAGKQMVQQTSDAIRHIDLVEISQNERMNTKRPAVIFSKQAPAKIMNTISLVRSQYLADDLAPINETNSFANQNSEEQSLDRGRVYASGENATEELFDSEGLKMSDKYTYSIKDKKYTTRHWQEKFQIQPEIPVKVVKFQKKSLSPLRESQKSPLQLSASRMQSQGIDGETPKSGWGERNYYDGYDDGSTQPNSANSGDGFVNRSHLPYFQYSFNVKKRAQSPTSSTRNVNFKELIDSEILGMSKGKTNFSRAMEFQNSSGMMSGNTSPTKSPISVQTSSTRRTSPSNRDNNMTQSQAKAYTKAIITDAGKRYRMPKTPIN